MLKKTIRYIIVGITFATILVSSSEDSKFYYIDNIDKIKELELLSDESLNIGDTLQSINILVELIDNIEYSDFYSDYIIADYYYKIGNLYLLMNETELSEKFFLQSIGSYNNSMLKNQLLMKDPLKELQLIYQNYNDPIRLNTVIKKLQKIQEIQNTSLIDSIIDNQISLDSFEQSIEKEKEIYIYEQLSLSEKAFDKNLYSQSVENLNNSLSLQSQIIGFTEYYNLSIMDSINLEYIYPAFESVKVLDSLNIKSDFFKSEYLLCLALVYFVR